MKAKKKIELLDQKVLFYTEKMLLQPYSLS